MPSKRRHNKRNISQLQDKMLSVNNRQTYRRTNLRIQLIIKQLRYVKTMDNRNNKKKGVSISTPVYLFDEQETTSRLHVEQRQQLCCIFGNLIYI